MERFIGYARVSDNESAKTGFSIEAQEQAIRTWCAENGVELKRMFVEPGRSGSKSYKETRPAFESAVRYVMAGLADGIVVKWMDRFSRNVLDFLVVRAELYQAGKTIISVEEPLLNGDPSDPVERFLAVAVMNAHQLMAEISGQKAAQGRDRRARAGKYPGTVPIGYTRIEGDIVPDDDQAAMISGAFFEFSAGKWTLEQWTKIAKDRGYRSNRSNPIARGQWYRIFRNRFYIGYFSWKGEEFQGDYQAIVDLLSFQAVQAILDSRGPEPGTQRHFWLLSGLLWSDVHKKLMVGAVIKGKFRYYRAAKKGTTEHNVKAEEIEQRVMDHLGQIGYTGQALSISENWRLAFSVAENMRPVFYALKTGQEKRELLRVIFARRGITVSRSGRIVDVVLLPGFERSL